MMTVLAGTIPVLAALCGEFSSAPTERPRYARAEAMPFAECVALVEDVSEELGVSPVSLTRTSDIWTARLDAVDGSLTITCSRPDNRLTLQRHPMPLTPFPAARG
jgi:hypothetical protein